MGIRAKRTFLLAVLTIVLLGLYRNLGVSLLAFWPLVLLDTFLRVPGDFLLNLVKPNIFGAAYELIRAVLELGFALFLWWGLGKCRAWLRPRPLQRETPLAPAREESPELTARRIRRKRLTTVGGVVIGLLIVNGRCGRGMVGLMSFLTHVQGYPLRVRTEVSVGDPGKTIEERMVEASKKPSIHRPPMLFLFEDRNQLYRLEYTAKEIWEIISQEGSTIFSYSGDKAPDNFKAWWEGWRALEGQPEKSPPKGEAADSIARKIGILRGGAERGLILTNLDILITRAGGGWRREQAGGFVVFLGKTGDQEVPFTISRASLPPCLIQAEKLEDACRFLQDLTGVPIILKTPPSEGEDLAGAQVGARPVQVSTDRSASLSEFVGEVALSKRLQAEFRENTIFIRDLYRGEVESRVKKLFDAFRLRKSWRWPAETLEPFPRDSSTFVIPYLDDPDQDVAQYAITVLREVGVGPALADFRRLLKTGRSKSGQSLSQGTLEELAAVLTEAGDPVALEYIEKLGKLSREEIGYWFEEAKSVEPTPGAVDIQDYLLRRYRARSPLLRPGKIRIKQLPSGVSQVDARAAERKALDVLNAFEDMSWDEEASATLIFSPDGKSAQYRLEISHYWGPLAAGGVDYTVDLAGIDGRWLVRVIKRGWGWMS